MSINNERRGTVKRQSFTFRRAWRVRLRRRRHSLWRPASLTPQSIITDNRCAVDASRPGQARPDRRPQHNRVVKWPASKRLRPADTIRHLQLMTWGDANDPRAVPAMTRCRLRGFPVATRSDLFGMRRAASRCATKQHVHSHHETPITSNDGNSHLIYIALTDVRLITANNHLNETTVWCMVRHIYVLYALLPACAQYCLF